MYKRQIYICAISGIDPQLYEAAMVDGAGRIKRIFAITLPGIAPTIVVLLIMAVPDLLNAGFDASYLLGNAMVSDYSEVLDTYVSVSYTHLGDHEAFAESDGNGTAAAAEMAVVRF